VTNVCLLHTCSCQCDRCLIPPLCEPSLAFGSRSREAETRLHFSILSDGEEHAIAWLREVVSCCDGYPLQADEFR
jgi:hypothetical protein